MACQVKSMSTTESITMSFRPISLSRSVLAAAWVAALPVGLSWAQTSVATVVPVKAAAAPSTSPQAMLARLQTLYPTQRFDTVRVSAMPGFYEVTLGKTMAYVEENGRYFLFGGLWDMQSRRDLTAERRAELEKVDVALFPRELGLSFGKGGRTLIVFSDPNCGYCKQLEHTLAVLPDVRVVVYPVAILGEASKTAVERIWCAPDRHAAWRDWMLKGVQPPASRADCNAPLEALQRLAVESGVQGTPTLFSSDGRKLAGAVPPEELASWLAQTPAGPIQGTQGEHGAKNSTSTTASGRARSGPSPKTVASAPSPIAR